MSTSVEVILLLLATGAATVNSGIGWINRPIFVFGLGITCIVFTYIHLVVVGAVGGWIISRKQQPPSI